ncbi:MAG: O-antigen ligase family protein [Hyphomonadaceae bacterium]|nr:O-antigen ligase family protein [Hyphomonadaceae bacterium]
MPGSQTVSAPNSYTMAPQTPVGRLEFALLIVILLIFSEGILPRLVSSDQSSDGSPLLRYLWLPVYAVAFAGMLWKVKDIARVSLRLPFLLGLIAVCAVSFTWSIEPGLTQRRSLAIFMTTIAGLYLGTRYSWQTMLRAIALTWFIIALSSFFTGLLSPSFGRMQEVHVGAWQGLFYEKNQLGGMMARAALFGAFLIIMDRKYRGYWASLVLLSSGLVVLSTSMTALLGLILGLGVLGLGAWMKRGMLTGLATLWVGVLMIAAGLAVLIFAPELVFQLLGRDMTLTGRTDIWIALVDYIEQRPLFGYGYGAFWSPDSDPGNWVRETLQWDAPTAHNGWFEVTLALGLVGLVLLILDFLLTVIRAVLASIGTWTGILALGYCAQFFLFSLSESTSLQQNSIIWVLYVAIAAKLAMRPRGVAMIKPAQPSRRAVVRTLAPV